MKRYFSMLVTVCMMALAFVYMNVSAAAECMTVFGDSIPDGYGLTKKSDNFVNMLAEEYGLTINTDAYNFAVSGAESDDILKKIRFANDKILQRSDIVIISAGGNDILNSYGKRLMESAMKYESSLAEAGITIDTVNPIQTLSQVTGLFLNPDTAEIVLEIFNDAESDSAMEEYRQAVEQFNANIQEMVARIREKGSAADIYFLTLYNPISVLAIDTPFFKSVEESIAAMQKDILSLAENNDKVYAVDVLEDFKGHYAEWTNINRFDIHPNADGHKRLYTLVSNAVKETAEQGGITEESMIQSSDTDISAVQTDTSHIADTSVLSEIPPNNDYIVWVIAGGIVLVSIAAAVVITIVKSSD